MADFDLSFLDGMNEDQLRQYISGLQAEKDKRAADAATYRGLRDAQDTAAVPAVAAQNQGKIATDDALQGAQVPDFVKMIDPSMAAPAPDEQARIKQLATVNAATSTATPGGDLSPDIEAASQRPGAHEIVSGDQRLVVDAAGNPLATRNEFPSLPQHIAAELNGEPNQASFMGTLGDALEGLSRPAATGFNYATSPKADISNLPGDIAGSVIGSSGSSGTVSEGGMVAKRGGGWGDVIRQRIKDWAQPDVGSDDGTETNPILKYLGPQIGAMMALPAGPIGMAYAGAKAREAITASEPKREATLGDVLDSIGLPSETFDTAIGAMAKAKYAAQRAEAGGLGAVGAAGRAISATVPALGLLFDSTKTDVDPGFAAPDDPDKIKSDLLSQFSPSRKLKDIDVNDPAIDAYGQVASMVYDPLNALPIEKAPEALAVLADKMGLPTAAKAARWAGSYDLTKAFSRESRLQSGLASDAIKAGAAPDVAAADAKKMAEGVYGEAQRVHAEAQVENNAQQALIEKMRSSAKQSDSPLVRQLLEDPVNGLVEKPRAQQLADIRQAASARNFQGLSTEDEALIKGIPQNLMQRPQDIVNVGRDMMFRRYRLADKLGVDMQAAHPWSASGDLAKQRALVSAKAGRNALARNLEEFQLRGQISERVSPEGFMPHVAEGLPYNPLKRREMARLGDVEVLRDAAGVVAENARSSGQQVPKLLNDFAKKPALRSDPMMVERVRQELFQKHNLPVWAPGADIEDAQRLAANRGAVGRGVRAETPVKFVQDPAQLVAAYRNAALPRQVGAAFQDGILGLRDLRGEPVAESLRAALLNPRYGAKDQMLLYKLANHPRGAFAGMFEQGRLIDDVHSYLDSKGLHYIGADEAKAMGMPKLGGTVVPKAIHKDFITTSRRLLPGALEKVAGFLAKANNIWAPIVLNTPGFHIRNALFGQFQVFLAVGNDIADAALWRAAGKVSSAAERGGLADGVITYLGKSHRIADLAAEARRMGVFEGGRVADLEGYLKRGMAPFQDQQGADLFRRLNPFSQRGLVTKEPLAKVAAGRGIGGALSLGAGTATAENVQRMMIYLQGRLKQGLNARQAAQNVVKFMFDYTGAHLGPFEKEARRLFPFYQWIKQSLLLTLDQLMKNPRRYAQVDHLFKTAGAFTGAAMNQDPRLKPAFLGQQGAIPAPFSRDSADARTWLSTERPGTQTSWLMEPLLRRDPAGALQGLFQQLGPVPSMGMEISRGKYLFGDRELDKNYVPDMSEPGIKGAVERFFGMQAHNIPEYVMRKFVGGYPGLATDTALNLVDPELVGNNPRFTGTDESNRRVNRTVSMLFGPRLTDTKPPAVAETAEKRLGTVIDKVHAQQVERAMRRSGQ